MKSSRLSVGLAVLLGALATLPALATWRVDTYNDKKVLTDDNWMFYLTAVDSSKGYYRLGISSYNGVNQSYVSGSGELDLTTVKDEANVTITQFARLMMSGVTTLTKIKIPDSVYFIDDNCFSGCIALRTVEPFLPGTVSTLGGAIFNGCTNLVGDLIVTNDNLTSFGANMVNGSLISSVSFSPKLKSLADNAFNGCTNVTHISPMTFPCVTSIGGWNFSPSPIQGDTLAFTATNLSYFGHGSFTGCRYTNLVFSSSVTTMGSGSSFGSNPNLKTVRCLWRKNGVAAGTSCSLGGNYSSVFASCPNLTEVTIPFRGTFSVPTTFCNNCTSLKHIYFWGTAPTSFADWCLPSVSYHYVFHCCMGDALSAWREYATALTEADKARATYPGGRCFGIKPSASYVPNAWLVWDRSPYQPGFMLFLK